MLKVDYKGYTFDDVLLVPQYSNILPADTDVTTKLTKKIPLNIPLLSAAMDTVTDTRMAIAMAQEGGIGIIHKNMRANLQAEHVAMVKKHESGIVKNPLCVEPNLTVKDLLKLKEVNKISGFPVIENGKLVGIITNRDLRFETNLDQPIKNIMSTQLVTVKEGSSIEQVRQLMHEHRLERVLIINNNNELKGLITVKDLTKNTIFPRANKDAHGQLLVGAALGVGRDTEKRVELLVEAGVDVVIIDTAHGHSQGVIDKLKWIKSHYANLNVIAGNIATGQAAKTLIDAGADGIKVGIGPGSICTTRIVAGVGVPQLSAIANVANAVAHTNIPIIADGGIRFSGDIVKALAAGASSIMLGNLLAGTDETPGDIELFQGRTYKTYRGMGSIGAMTQGSADRYFQDNNTKRDKLVPEGIEGRVPHKGPLSAVLHQLIGGIKSALGYMGAANIGQLQQNAQFIEISNAGIQESHVHDVQIVKESPNYNIQ
jgi:IMP dehydrogenase